MVQDTEFTPKMVLPRSLSSGWVAEYHQTQTVIGGFPPTCQVAAGEACQGKPNPTQGWAWGGTRLAPQQVTVQGGIFGSGRALELGGLDIAT